MKIELHILQNFAPSCLNRDDTNSPKDCVFGGVQRARISSQCLKRSIRMSPEFQPVVEGVEGIRTKGLLRELRTSLVDLGAEEEKADSISRAFVECYSGFGKESNRTKVLLYLGTDEIGRMSQKLWERWDELVSAAEAAAKEPSADDKGKKSNNQAAKLDKMLRDIVKTCGSDTRALDIALFGRMVAELPAQKVDAACQVAHAISTHRVSHELDFYTAVDDLLGPEETGAGMMGTIEFNSACYYRYHVVDLHQLGVNLGNSEDLARDGVLSFIRAAVEAVPTARQTSTAAQNRPSFVLAIARDSGAPQSLANAFEKPVIPTMSRGGGLVEQSIRRLDDYWGKLNRMYGSRGICEVACCMLDDVELEHLESARVESIEQLLGAVRRAMM
jgi:CRISPR system Cascade subunit CasC